MWELISANRRKSIVLFILMGTCLVLMGLALGSYFYPNGGGVYGLIFALIAWLILSWIAYFAGDSIFLAVGHAKEVTREIHPQLFNVVEEMKIASGLPIMPKIYIIDEEAMNAFAVGRSPNNCAIAVTAGLLAKLDRDELQGVIAHEMSHIVNRDSLYMTFAGVTLGAVMLITNIFWYTGRLGGMRYRFRSSRSSGGGAAQLLIPILAIIFIIVGAIMARLLYFAISRRREYLADASAVRLTRYPDGLANALEKISGDVVPLVSANKVTAPLYIANPIGREVPAKIDWQSTHPPISERIKILRSMSMGAGYNNYQEAYSKVRQSSAAILPNSALSDKKEVPIINPAKVAPSVADKKTTQRALGDLIMTVNNYMFLNCTCGLKIKVPPDINQTKIACPLCGKEYEIPEAKSGA
jgi:heat shock protein HtpX